MKTVHKFDLTATFENRPSCLVGPEKLDLIQAFANLLSENLGDLSLEELEDLTQVTAEALEKFRNQGTGQ